MVACPADVGSIDPKHCASEEELADKGRLHPLIEAFSTLPLNRFPHAVDEPGVDMVGRGRLGLKPASKRSSQKTIMVLQFNVSLLTKG